ncbi:unnamed protein product [Nippostrongylus brasiliensis]|uniref:Osmotic stress resistance protein (inferred by orthology to a C. elegans protein) n=1 Tax=Nippostrongylus brasiliensis TaxID=27835 RepID=A0A0N4YWU1_NIPBR|nr:unnamed protein product [Nippostrongylus brasiliensis]
MIETLRAEQLKSCHQLAAEICQGITSSSMYRLRQIEQSQLKTRSVGTDTRTIGRTKRLGLLTVELQEDFFPWIFAKADRMFQRAMTSIQLENTLTVQCRRHSSEEKSSETGNESLLLPSKLAVEQIGAKFLDALIKRGQMEMAKGAFRTQLEVLEKVHPEQYEKYKKLKVEDLAADAVMQQAEMAKLQPKTGNPLVDMLNENGIPIASSLKGIEQAIKTQKEMETMDPSEQVRI